MNILSFNFVKINAERKLDFKHSSINTNIEFIDIEKDEIAALKASDVIKVNFNFIVTYSESKEDTKNPAGKVFLEGSLLLSADKEEAKELLDAWKKKELPENTRTALFNLILRKCSIKALSLEEELGLPYHLPLPKLQNAQKKEK